VPNADFNLTIWPVMVLAKILRKNHARLRLQVKSMLCRRFARGGYLMIEALIFDIDGVLIWHEKWFSMTLSDQKYNNPVNVMSEYHRGEVNTECDRGIKNPITEIEPFLKKIKWDHEAKDYLDMKYEFESKYIDYEMLKEIKSLKQIGIKAFIGSNQNHYRKAFLKNRMKIDDIFDEAYFSCDFGYVKPEKEFWDNMQKRIMTKYGEIKKENVIFLDDMSCNIESANEYGYQARIIKNRDDVIDIIRNVRA
jgi:FMN phosphatase YigB (HAD superfamily)